MAKQQTRILVTGASSGIGAAFVRKMAGPDRVFVLHARGNADGLAKSAAVVSDAGGRAETVLADLSRPGEGRRVASFALDRVGGLDTLIANAGFADKTPLSELDGARAAEVMTAIAGSFGEMVRTALPAIAAAPDGRGRIVAVSAFGAHVWRTDVPAFPATAAAKAALEATAKAAALSSPPPAPRPTWSSPASSGRTRAPTRP